MQKTLQNRTIFCHDNLDILRGIDSATIDLIYLDPPFNKKKTFTAPIGSSAEGASFSDIFRRKDVKEEWLQEIQEENFAIHNFLSSVKNIEGRTSYNFCYLAYMAIRLIECERILKNTGSIYLHCDPTMSHYLKLLLDCIFGEENFRNEIIWSYRTGGISKRHFGRKHDVILFYAMGKYTFNVLKEKAYTKSESRKPGIVNYGAGEAEFFEDADGVYNWVSMRDAWEISYIGSTSDERTGYPTQKPLTLLKRIIEASTNKGDVVLDPFCGCATTLLAAESLERQWVGIDISIKAYDLLKERLGKEIEQSDTIFHENLITFQTAPPARTDKGGVEVKGKYVYIISHKHYPGEYKVGIASDPKKRLDSYQTADPDRSYKLEFSLQTPHFREIEKHIHSIYENKHEWVRGDMKKIIADIKGFKPAV